MASIEGISPEGIAMIRYPRMSEPTTMRSSVDILLEKLNQADDPAEKIPFLLALAGHLRFDGEGRGVAYAREALRLAKSIGDTVGMIRSLSALAWPQMAMADYPGALSSLNKARALMKRVPTDPDMRSMIHAQLGELYVIQSDYRSALKWYGRSLDAGREQSGGRSHRWALLNMGRMFVRLGDYAGALDYMSDALSLAEDADDREMLPQLFDSIGMVHIGLNDPQSALQRFSQALEMFRQAGMEIPAALTLTNIGQVHINRREWEPALDHLQRALEVFRHERVNYYVARTLEIIGRAHLAMEQYDPALGYIAEAVPLNESIGNGRGVSSTLLAAAEIHIAMARPDEGGRCIDRALTIARELEDPNLMFQAYEILSTLHEELGDPAESLRYYKLYHSLKDSVASAQAQRAAVMLEVRGEMEKLRKDRELLRRKVEEVERELATTTLQLTRKTRRVAKIEKTVRSYAKQKGTAAAPGMLRGLLAEIRESRNEEVQWSAFERKFEHLHPGFMHTLSSRCPALTPTELRVCVLLRIGLSTKDIAGILCTSLRTIDNHRRHIRVKLGLPHAANLTTFLTSVL